MKFMKYILMAAIVFLPACKHLSCGSNGEDPGETLKKYETDEHVFFIDERLCEPGAVVARSRTGSVIDFCADAEAAKKMVAIPPRVTGDVFYYGRNLPVADIMRDSDATPLEVKNGEASRNNFEMRGRSAYWAALNREEFFLRKYREGIPYPKPGTKEADEEAFMGKWLAVKHSLNR